MSAIHPAFRIEGPALVSFSGGRTSGFMLHEIIRAHGGTLPDDVRVVFANTGKEREETLRFVHECGKRWRVPIAWLEWRRRKPGFELVEFGSASRQGEPFAALIASKQRLPNWQERWCTQHLKVGIFTKFAASFDWCPGAYSEVIGLRFDEGLRIFRGLENAEKDGRRCLYPLARAKIKRADVMAFWRAQPFDLGLQPWEGNCDLCFLKGRGIRKRIIRGDPARADWWIREEARGRFDKRDSYAGLVDEVRRSPELFDPPDDLEFDAECGTHCGLE